ncbi:hypothetical protein KJ599_08745 [bacterium]|nr:hypothetical protein [bacterium]
MATDPRIAIASIALIVCWKFTGYYGLFFLSGLNNIHKSFMVNVNFSGVVRERLEEEKDSHNSNFLSEYNK